MCLCNLDTFFMVLVHWIFHKMWPYSIKIKNKYNNIFCLFSLIMSFVLGWWTWVRIMPTQKWNQVVSWLDIIKQSLWIVCHKFSNIIVTIYVKNKCRIKKKKKDEYCVLWIVSWNFLVIQYAYAVMSNKFSAKDQTPSFPLKNNKHV